MISRPLLLSLPLLGMGMGMIGLGHAQAQTREPWTTSRIQGSPEAPKPYVPEQVFPNLKVDNTLELVAAGGRFYTVTRQGKVWSFPERPETADQAELVLDLKALHPEHHSAYSIAFHPNWRQNREVFLCYTYDKDVADGSRLSRFKLTEANPPKIIPGSEEILLTWLSGGHNGCQLQFGPDGFLYFSTGDAKAPSPPDELNTGQDNSDLLSCVLRIDVDRRDSGLAYAVPPGNPFVGQKDVRPEIWAFGFRNPWRISFDPASGRLWCGDVGWELWEMVHLVRRGGNHGWSAIEATQPIKPETLSPLAPITPPVVAHPHTEAASITGGYVYHGKRLPGLDGAYIYGDYETGKIWALWHDGDQITRHEEIADTPHRISTFGLDGEGELYYVHWGTPGGIYRLSPNPNAGKPSSFPRKLSEAGVFADVVKQTPAPGVYEFEIAEPMWQDGATARRFVALPQSTGVQTQINKSRDGTISTIVTWPKDAVLAKTISSSGSRLHPLETQVLHYDGETWNGYSYRWNEAGTDAELVGANGEETRAWRFHGRAECARCHNNWSGFALGFQPQQLASILDPREGRQPAAKAVRALGLTDANYFKLSSARLVHSGSDGPALEDRARSWLHSNCAHCHRRHGGGSVPLMVNAELPLAETDLLDQKPTRGDFGLTEARVISPGAPWRSVLSYRVSMTGSGHMPMIGTREADPAGHHLLWQWIESMGTDLPALADLQKDKNRTAEFLKSLPGSDSQTQPDFTPMLVSVSDAMQLAHAMDDGRLSRFRDQAVSAGLASPNAAVRVLFERFVPPERRVATLGANVDAAKLLAIKGSAARGAELVSIAGKCSTCLACHFINGAGRDFGPELSKVGARLTREQLLESLLHPSKVIAPDHLAFVLETTDGQMQTGFMVRQDGESVTLKLPTGQTQTFPQSAIKSRKPLPSSLMPEGLLQSLTAEEAADLVEYLGSLK